MGLVRKIPILFGDMSKGILLRLKVFLLLQNQSRKPLRSLYRGFKKIVRAKNYDNYESRFPQLEPKKFVTTNILIPS